MVVLIATVATNLVVLLDKEGAALVTPRKGGHADENTNAQLKNLACFAGGFSLPRWDVADWLMAKA